MCKYNEYLNDIENNFDFSSIGKKYDVKEVSNLHFHMATKRYEFRLINLYKYEPQKGHAPITSNTRRFCSQLYLRTQDVDNYLTFKEVESLSSPGKNYKAKDVLYHCGNYSKDLDFSTCRHRWIRFKFDPESGLIVRDSNQPRFRKTKSKK